jgi:RNA polymerase sigma-32 factor
VQEGNLGLLQAIDRFDPERGLRLATYAAWWIRAYILRYVEHNDRMVRGTTTKARLRLFYQLERTRQRLLARGEDPTASAIARELGVDDSDVVAMELLAPPIASLDARVPGHDGEAPARIDRLADDAASPEQWLGEHELRNQLDGALDRFGRTLQGRSLELFHERVAAPRPVSLRELSRRWGVTPATARRIETRVARPLRRFLFEQMGDSIAADLSAPSA